MYAGHVIPILAWAPDAKTTQWEYLGYVQTSTAMLTHNAQMGWVLASPRWVKLVCAGRLAKRYGRKTFTVDGQRYYHDGPGFWAVDAKEG